MPSPTEDPTDDASLIERIANGDRSALAALARRHGPAILRHAARMTRDEASAEDALQDTLLAVLEHASTFRARDDEGRSRPVRGWLFTIARHAILRRARRGHDAVREELDDDLSALGAAAGFGCPLDFVGAFEEREAIERVLATLGDDDREVLALVDAEGLSLEEASATLGVSLAALKSRLHRARLRFMAAMRIHATPTRGEPS